MIKTYKDYTIKHAKKSHLFKDLLFSFIIGGNICLLGEGILRFSLTLGMEDETAKKVETISLIFLACLFTGIGWFDNLAKHAGAGTLVPICGFANAMCSPTIDNKAEGWVLGVGAKMFIIAGPVIVYGVSASVVYGFIYWLTTIL